MITLSVMLRTETGGGAFRRLLVQSWQETLATQARGIDMHGVRSGEVVRLCLDFKGGSNTVSWMIVLGTDCRGREGRRKMAVWGQEDQEYSFRHV